MKSSRLLLALVLIAGVLSGCAVGNRYDYQSTNIALPVTGDADLALGVIDERSYVLNGDKKPNFIGLQRGGFGNPFDVTTKSGQPLTDEMATALVRGLQQRGFNVTGLHFSSPDASLIASAIATEDLDRAVVLTAREWKTDAYASLTLHYDLLLQIIDADAKVLAENQIQGTEKIGGASFESKNAATAGLAFERKVGQLFNNEAIKQALEN